MTNWITGYNTNSPQAAAIPVMTKNFQYGAEELGFQVLNYVDYEYMDFYPERRHNILDTFLAPVQPGDTVVMQFPMFISGAFQEDLINRLSAMPEVKIVTLTHDIPTWMYADENGTYNKNDNWMKMLKKVDGIIAANKKGAVKLREDGIKSPIVPLTVGDYIYDGPLLTKKFRKKLYYVGGREVSKVDYQGVTPFNLYTGKVGPDLEKNSSVIWHGRKPSGEILASLDGGFGIVTSENIKENNGLNFKYYVQYNNPSKLSFYLAAGLPVITTSKTAHTQWVEDRGIGLIVDDLNDIDGILQNMTQEDYDKMIAAIKPWQTAVTTGFFVKRALIAMLGAVNLGLKDALA
jgi:hypothetical protein